MTDGRTPPHTHLSSARGRQPRTDIAVIAANHTKTAISGEIRLAAPDFVGVTPATIPVRLPPGERIEQSVLATVARPGKAATFDSREAEHPPELIIEYETRR